ncbi:MAG: hypothetical protein Kow0088_17820 [Anaerolineales bacterium]
MLFSKAVWRKKTKRFIDWDIESIELEEDLHDPVNLPQRRTGERQIPHPLKRA